MTTEDYDSKVSKLLNNFSDEFIDAERNSNKEVDIVNKKICFLNEKGNENILFNITNDESHIIEINKNKFDLNIGDRILQEISKEKYKNNLSENISELDDQPSPKKLTNKKLPRFKSISSRDKKIHLKVNSIENKDEFSMFLMSKITKLKITIKDFLMNTPKCDLCDKTGITLEDLRKMSNSTQIDAIALGYILHQCSGCKVFIHRNCLNNVDDKNFPILNVKDLHSFTWTCGKCKEEKTNNGIITCETCNKSEKDSKLPHMYLQGDNYEWNHGVCLLWKKTIVSKISDSQIVSNIQCYKCSDLNYTAGLTIKCFANDCNEFFHPICMRECLSYYNFTTVEDIPYGVIYCEEHSKIFLINTFNNIFSKEK